MQVLDHNLQLRMDARELKKLKKKCGKIRRNHSDVLREIITAFNDGRLTITKTDEQKGEEFYVD